MEVWTKRGAGADGNKFVLSKREAGGGGIAYSVYQSKTDYAVMQITLDGSTAETILEGNATKGNMKFDQDKWVHQAYVRDVGAVAAFGYVDGDCTGTKTLASVSSLYVSSGPLYLGNRNYNRPEAYNGQIDEVRISRVARSADWIKASHDCIADVGFASYELANDWHCYSHKFSIAFEGAPATPLAEFPVLVRLSENQPQGFSYADCRKPNGGDLRFADGTDHLLPCEVDTWNPDGESLVWVKVPSLSRSTRIFAYYGWKFAPQVDAADVWDANYVGVWHLGEKTLPLVESTGVGTPFSVSSNLTAAAFSAAGKVGGAVDFTQTEGGTRPWLSAEDDDDFDGFDSFTVEVWTTRGQVSGNKFVLSKREPGDSEVSYCIFQNGSGVGVLSISTDGSASSSAGYSTILQGGNSGMSLAWGQWSHQAYVRDVDEMKAFGYVNGEKTGEPALGGSDRLYAGAAKLYLGNQTRGRPEAFNGQIDELRISRVARSAAWIKASHDTVADDAFARYSSARKNDVGFVLVVR